MIFGGDPEHCLNATIGFQYFIFLDLVFKLFNLLFELLSISSVYFLSFLFFELFYVVLLSGFKYLFAIGSKIAMAAQKL